MSADNIIYSELFEEFFILTETEKFQPVKAKENPLETNTKITFTGTNKRKTLFVYNDINQLSENDLTMIRNLVVKGIGWSMEDIALINLSENSDTKFEDIRNFFSSEKIIFWGCETFMQENKIPRKVHEVIKGREINILSANMFSFYSDNIEQKKNLWEAMKKIFDRK